MSIESELLEIKGDNELLIVEDVHTWATRHKKSLLAKELEWDDEKAGYQFRLWQIRRLIALHISFEDDGERRMVSLTIDRTKPGGGYRDLDEVLKSKSLHAILLNDALSDLDRLKKKYERLKDLEPVWKAVGGVLRRHKGRKKAA